MMPVLPVWAGLVNLKIQLGVGRSWQVTEVALPTEAKHAIADKQATEHYLNTFECVGKLNHSLAITPPAPPPPKKSCEVVSQSQQLKNNAKVKLNLFNHKGKSASRAISGKTNRRTCSL